MPYGALADLARPTLITAAMRRSTLTYGELGRALDHDPKLPLAHHLNPCPGHRVAAGASRRRSRRWRCWWSARRPVKPGDAFRQGHEPWYSEARQCSKKWQPR